MTQAHFRIVAQVAQNGLRRLRIAGLRRWALALVLPLGLMFTGVLTAFGIAPNTITDTVERTQVVEAIALQLGDAAAVPSQPAIYWREERIQRGDSLARVLSRLRINDSAVMTFLNHAPEARPLFQLMPGRSLRASMQADGSLLTLHYLNGERLLTIAREGDKFTATEKPAKLESRVVSVAGEIRSSLFAAADALNIPDAIAKQMIELFSTEVNFHRDLHKSDRFSVVYEALYDDGEPVAAVRLLSAEYVNRGRTFNVVWFEPNAAKPGEGAYYTLEGRDIRKAFLRSPLEFSRVSSGFTEERLHPILNTWTAHKGVDFAAPLGTNIKAAADGVVEFVGVQSGYGNVVILAHPNKYSTLYAHMAGFASELKVGTRVRQGDLLGTVGMTGLTTGPHVHFEFRIDGVHHDPLTVGMPNAFPASADFKQKFQQASAPLARTMSLLRSATPSSFE